MQAHIHPSILSADFANFETEFASIAEADAIHVDVMDGHFVPNLTFGLPVVKRLVEVSSRPIDVHLMIENVDTLAIEYAKAGADSVTFHFEASQKPVELARELRKIGAKAAVAIKPGTPIEVLFEDLAEFDMVLVMTVEPGFGGQRFMAEMLTKVERISDLIREKQLPIRVQIDGGVDLLNVSDSARAGADTFVAGSCVFGSNDRAATIKELRSLAQANLKG
jgi:ribulose-phosphate 3-epimerase